MSTKTTFKRVALVTVAALGFGVLTSVAPAIAASNATAVKMTPTVLTTAPRVGETVTILVNHSGFFATPSGTNYAYQVIETNWSGVPLTSTTTAKPVMRQVAASNNTYGQLTSYRMPTGGVMRDGATNNTGQTDQQFVIDGGAGGVFNVWETITFVPDVAGTWVINVQDPDRATYYNQDITVTVAGGTYSTAVTNVYTGETTTAADVNSTSTDVYNVDGIAAVATASTDAAATFKVTQKDANGVALSVATKSITISTTIGCVGTTATTCVSSYAAVAASATAATQNQLLYLFPDGRSGKAVVTIAVNGVTVSTYNVTFYGTTIASLAMAPYKPVIGTNIGSATGGEAVETDDTGDYTKSSWQFILVAKDSNGNEIIGGDLGTAEATPKLTISSSNPAVATAAVIDDSYSSVYGGWKVTGTAVGAGTTTITVADKLTGLIKATGVITVASTTIGSIVLATDATDYKPGDKVTVTLTAKDASGNPIADGVYFNLLSGAVASTQTLNATPWAAVRTTGAYVGSGLGYDAGDVSFTAGVAKATFYAPASTFKLTASLSATNARLAYALQGTDLTVTATVTNESTVAANAALDAASEATDAANAATDAANAAAEAADAATAAAQDAADAVAVLSAQVATLISGLKAQLTALTNLVIKIQKKVKA